MVKLDNEELLCYLNKNNIDVLAVAISPFHALGIDAFLYDISKKLKRKVQTLILILPHQTDGYVISEDDFQYRDFLDIKFYFIDIASDNQSLINERLPNFISKYKTIFSGIRNIRSKKGINKLYLLSPYLPYIELLMYFKDKKISSKYDPVFVLVDEGYASYVSTEHWNLLRKEVSREADYSLLDTVSSKIFRFVDFIFREMVDNSMSVNKRFLFRIESHLVVNDSICRSYRHVLKLRKNDLKMDISGKTVVIISQPFSEMKTMELTDELRLMQSVIKCINRKDIKPILKPHPREKSDKYIDLKGDFEIIKNNFPVEEIIPNLNPICVIGYSSTALLNSKIFYGITAISLSDVMLPISNNKMLNDSDEEFKNLTSNYIYFLEDIEDLEKYI